MADTMESNIIFWQASLFGISLRIESCLFMVFPPFPSRKHYASGFLLAFFPTASNREPRHAEGAFSLSFVFCNYSVQPAAIIGKPTKGLSSTILYLYPRTQSKNIPRLF